MGKPEEEKKEYCDALTRSYPDKSSEEIEEKYKVDSAALVQLERDIIAMGHRDYITNAEQVLENLKKASTSEKILTLDVLNYVARHVQLVRSKTSDQKRRAAVVKKMATFLSGGHIVFDDGGGLFYKRWLSFAQNLVSRSGVSSHSSVDKQFAIRGAFVKEALFGTRLDAAGKKHTWIQLEKHPTGLRYVLPHMVSYAAYKLTGKNIGPYGHSLYTEAAPMWISASRRRPHRRKYVPVSSK